MLIARSARHRAQFAAAANGLRGTFALLDIGYDLGRLARRWPVVLIAGVAALWLVRPARLIRWMRRGLSGYFLYRDIRKALQRQPRHGQQREPISLRDPD